MAESTGNRDDTDAAAAFASCLACLRDKDPRAGSFLQDLLRRYPAFAAGWDTIGEALLEAGKSEAALVAFHRALQGDPTLARALRCGSVLRGGAKLAEAREAYRRAAEIEPRSARGWFGLALCSQDLGHLAEAADHYSRALACEPMLAEAHVNLGTVLQAMGDLDGAKAAYARGVKLRPDTFGRIAQALTAEPNGELWLDLGRLRQNLAG